MFSLKINRNWYRHDENVKNEKKIRVRLISMRFSHFPLDINETNQLKTDDGQIH